MSESLPIAFAFYPLLLTGIALAWLFNLRHQAWPTWTVGLLACSSIITFAFLTSPWAFTSYYLRYLLPGLFAVAAFLSNLRTEYSGPHSSTHNTKRTVSSVLVLVLFAILNVLSIASHYPARNSLDVTFPLRAGNYYVLQGGNSFITNPFHVLANSKLAIDIVKLNAFGNRADGLAPRALSAYEIFAETLYSPCQGRISHVRDSQPDNPPGNPDTEHPEGNYIELKCTGADILMAHLKHGSIKVAAGEIVSMGQPLAEIGNSGNTLEPHLHIAATKGGVEIGLKFDGHTLSINSLVTR